MQRSSGKSDAVPGFGANDAGPCVLRSEVKLRGGVVDGDGDGSARGLAGCGGGGCHIYKFTWNSARVPSFLGIGIGTKG